MFTTLPIDQQLRRNDCGISAIKTICNILQVDMPRSYIAAQLPLTEEGVSFDAIDQFFKKNGFSTQFHLIDPNQLDQEFQDIQTKMPCLVPVKVKRGLHYVILKAYKKGVLEIWNPSKPTPNFVTLEGFKKWPTIHNLL